jgi:hypothetical protein
MFSAQGFLPKNMPLPVPQVYVNGFDTQLFDSEYTQTASYMLGERSYNGWWYYYLVVFVLKTPLPILIMLCWAIVLFTRNIREEKERNVFVYLLTFIVVYFAFFSAKGMCLGVRYLLPIYGPIFLLTGQILKKGARLTKIVMSTLTVWLVVGIIYIFPHHLSFFNLFAGGPENGYKYLANSNADWGQDLISLRDYMDEHGIEQVYLSHFGLVRPEIYGVTYVPIPVDGNFSGTAAISVNHLLGISPWKEIGDSYQWLRQKEISGRAGYSILIYEIEKKDHE